MQIEAIYENGSLHPVVPLPLLEHQRVTVTISAVATLGERSRLDVAYIEEAQLLLVILYERPTPPVARITALAGQTMKCPFSRSYPNAPATRPESSSRLSTVHSM